MNIQRVIVGLCLVAGLAAAGEWMLYTPEDGRIVAHGATVTLQDGKMTIGTMTVSPITTNTHALAWVASVPEKAKLIGDCASVTNVVLDDIEQDYDSWSPREKKMIKLIVQQLNVLRTKAGLPALTKKQVMSALKEP